jgi:RimJ/RimL family protein N-acetyltransferase
LEYGIEKLGLHRIVAITSKDNDLSSNLLEKIGMNFERLVVLPPDTEELKLFAFEK